MFHIKSLTFTYQFLMKMELFSSDQVEFSLAWRL